MGRHVAPLFLIHGGMIMRKLIALLFALLCLFGSAVSESPATPTDLIEIEDDDFGYIDPSLIHRQVFLQWLKEPTYYGETVTLVAILTDFLPTDIYTFRWEYCISDEELTADIWHIIENETQQTYTFVIDTENCHYWWRVVVIL